MSKHRSSLWESFENRAPLLFLAAGLLSLVAGVNYGVTELFDSISFNSWVGLTVLLARVASLLGVAGLSVRLRDRNARVGKVSRAVVVLAIVCTVALLVSGVLSNLGAEHSIQAVLGLGTVALSLITYLLFGVAVLRIDSHSRLVGPLLLVAAVALLFGMFGRAALPIGVVGTAAEGALFVTHVAIGYRLMAEPESKDHAELSPETVAE
jgi:hypothetical protein